MAFEIKKLNSEDFDLAKLLFLFFQVDDGVENPTAAPDEHIKKLLTRDDFNVIVAFENDVLVGGLVAYELIKYKLEDTEMFLYEIGVEASHRRKGIAGELFEYMRNLCVKKGISEMFVATSMDNESAKEFYKATGGDFESAAIYTFEFD